MNAEEKTESKPTPEVEAAIRRYVEEITPFIDAIPGDGCKGFHCTDGCPLNIDKAGCLLVLLYDSLHGYMDAHPAPATAPIASGCRGQVDPFALRLNTCIVALERAEQRTRKTRQDLEVISRRYAGLKALSQIKTVKPKKEAA